MYYSSGNYEAFAHPLKPEGIENKSAYIIGSGLAALSAACFLVRDAQMDGKRIHILEKDALPGGACDGYQYPGLGYTMRAAAKWTITLKSCGICSATSHPSKTRTCPFWITIII